MRSLDGLINLFSERKLFPFAEKNEVLVTGADRAYKLYAAIYIYLTGGDSVFFVAADDYEAKRYYREAAKYLEDDEVLFYPRESLYFSFADSISEQNSTLRAKVASAGARKRKRLIITSIWALAEKRLFSGPENIKRFILSEDYDFGQFIALIASYGYVRSDTCYSPGQFSVRGGIVDIFPSSSSAPYRLEFFGDMIDSIRVYDPETQLSEDSRSTFELAPFFEGLLTEEDLSVCMEGLKTQAQAAIKKVPKEKRQQFKENFDVLEEKLKLNPQEIARLAYMYAKKPLKGIAECFGKKRFIFVEPATLKHGYDSVKRSVLADFTDLKAQGVAFKSQAEVFYEYTELMDMLSGFNYSIFVAVEQSMPGLTSYKEKYNAGCADLIGRIDLGFVSKQIPFYLSNGYSVIFVGSEDEKENVRLLLDSQHISLNNSPSPGSVSYQVGRIYTGIDSSVSRVVLIPAGFGEKAAAKKKKEPTEAQKEAFFSDIAAGDYIVHDTYGIGRYDGIFKITLEGTSKDYIKILYAKEDVLYVPPEQMNLLQKYIGPNEVPPKLSNLGGGEWESAKSKVKRAVKKLADEYIAMYAERRSSVGYAFAPDTAWQGEFENAFRFEATPGQLKATEEIKSDMESDVPMDRLLCGDVGYGKTEVAQRAAFKAVMEGKQVAVLVPTTILALQHYNNFSERFSAYPIKIEMLSRFRNQKQTDRIISELRKGAVDIIIGTHKLLNKSVIFKDLGLVVVDEEQRFGVAHKDRLKLIKKNVDCLTLSATPIPRTLHMSMIGIKDMSVLDTPPANKAEIKTYVMEKNDSVIAEAIRNELARDGQVFYVYNRVSGIEREADRLSALVPGAVVDFAHGQMNESELEERIMRFLNRETDVLVCTVIIENGVDFTNANTIIISDADRLGLSQLYQLRGRVGRSDRQAYAYMLYRAEKILSEVAAKRLAAIKEFTRFGSGFKVALRDLQLRGAGEMLGSSQHGHFANVGYEMYSRLLGQAVAEKKGTLEPTRPQTEIDLKLDLYIPPEYIPAEEGRIEMYKSIAFIANEDDRDEVTEELIDRYGDIPNSVTDLMRVALIKAKASMIGIKKIRSLGSSVYFEFEPSAEFDVNLINTIDSALDVKLKNQKPTGLCLVLNVKSNAHLLDYCEEIVGKLLALPTN